MGSCLTDHHDELFRLHDHLLRLLHCQRGNYLRKFLRWSVVQRNLHCCVWILVLLPSPLFQRGSVNVHNHNCGTNLLDLGVVGSVVVVICRHLDQKWQQITTTTTTTTSTTTTTTRAAIIFL